MLPTENSTDGKQDVGLTAGPTSMGNICGADPILSGSPELCHQNHRKHKIKPSGI